MTGQFYVIAGPNEPPTEKWMTTAVKNLAPGCGGLYCDSELDTIAAAMADFSNYVLTNTNMSRRIPGGGKAGLLSPVWNCTHPNTAKLMAKYEQQLRARGRSMSQFDGIAINAYNVDGQLATVGIQKCKASLKTAMSPTDISNFNYYLTETGMLKVAEGSVLVPAALARDNLRELFKLLRNDSSIKAGLIFSATGRNPGFLYDFLDKPCEWQYILGGHAQL